MDDRTWTDDIKAAKIFSASRIAVDFCIQNQIQKSEVVLKDGHNVRVPISPECKEI